MYIVNTLQVQELVHNVIRIINQEQGKEIEMSTQSEESFHMEE